MAASDIFYNVRPGQGVTNNYYGGRPQDYLNAPGDPNAPLDWGALLGQLATGGYDIYRATAGGTHGDVGRAKESAAMADPFASQRPQYQQQLQQLMTDPNSFKQDPGYQFALGQGQEAISGASNALYGGTRAGSLYPELAKYTEGYASQSYDNRIQQLMQMAGVQAGSPGTAGALNAGGYQNQSSDLGGGVSNLLRSLFPQAGAGFGSQLMKLLFPNSSRAGPDPGDGSYGPQYQGPDPGDGSYGPQYQGPDPGDGTYGPQWPGGGGGDPFSFGDPGGMNDFGGGGFGGNDFGDLGSFFDP
jgi:hypothetical protein